MRVSPRRYEKLEQAELGCKYLIGVQITEINDEDRKRYLSFIFPKDLRSFPALKKQIAPEMEVSYAPIEQEPTRARTSWATGWRGLAWKPIYQITEISEEDRRRYLRLIAPEVVRNLPAVQKETASENGQSWPAIQIEIAPEQEVSYAPLEQEPTRERTSWVTWWRGLAWKPIYAAAIIVIGVALVIGAARQLKRSAGNLRAKETQASPALGPDDRAANTLSPLATPNEPPVENPGSSSAIIALNDRTGMVTVDNGGHFSGLDDVPPPTPVEIAKTCVSRKKLRPATLKDLGG